MQLRVNAVASDLRSKADHFLGSLWMQPRLITTKACLFKHVFSYVIPRKEFLCKR